MLKMSLSLNDLKEEQKQIAEVVGMDTYLELTKVFGGTSIYIAKADEIERRNDRNSQILEEFNGSNYRELALKYGLTETWIRNIVFDKAAEIRKKPIDGQMSLSDFLQ